MNNRDVYTAEEIARATREIERLREAVEQMPSAPDYESCKWCGQLCDPNILGFCGLKCSRQVLGPFAEDKIKEAEQAAREEVERRERAWADQVRAQSASAPPERSNRGGLLGFVATMVVVVAVMLLAKSCV